MATVVEINPIFDHLSPDKVIDMLRKHGTIVTIEEARLILPFLQNLANIAVAQALREQPVHAIAA
jgi:hypothetical protein